MNIEQLLMDVLNNELYCEDCGSRMDPDQNECTCGTPNPAREMGFI